MAESAAESHPQNDQTSWYRHRPIQSHPYKLLHKLSPADHRDEPLASVAVFPWTHKSLEKLWDGDYVTSSLAEKWRKMIDDFSGTIAVGGASKLYVFPSGSTMTPFRIIIPPVEQPTPKERNVRCIAWAFNRRDPLEPLVVYTYTSLVYVLNIKQRRVVSCLRGHGGLITSIAVHTTHPYIFSTTSRDFTTRIYDLSLTPRLKPNNPHWSHKGVPSLGGAAHGLQMSEPEGKGIGRCVAVLVGGRSGGHEAAVLGAAFHPVLPLLATCGLDRVVKIWRIPDISGETLVREDKPLFSSSKIHKAGVFSVAWLSQDMLITHSSRALMRRDPEDANSTYWEDGMLILWRWLGVDRFFPPNQPYQKVLRGCASDYQESASFKLISISSLPAQTKSLHVHREPFLDPLVFFSSGNAVRVLNVTHFKPRPRPPFPGKLKQVEEMTKKMHLGDDDIDENDGEADLLPGSVSLAEGWTVRTTQQAMVDALSGAEHSEKFEACDVGPDGHILVAVSDQGNIWVWTDMDVHE